MVQAIRIIVYGHYVLLTTYCRLLRSGKYEKQNVDLGEANREGLLG